MAEARPWDFVKPSTSYVSDEVAAERMTVCDGCESLRLKTCMKCGCVMPLKTRLAHAECPVGKWGAVAVPANGVTEKENPDAGDALHGLGSGAVG
jgi:hypothetical protein